MVQKNWREDARAGDKDKKPIRAVNAVVVVLRMLALITSRSNGSLDGWLVGLD